MPRIKKTGMLKKVCKCVLIFCLLAVMLRFLEGIMERKDSEFKYRPFFDQTQDFDVLFLGTSHVINGIFPMELWHDYGLVSYNFGGHGNPLPTSYWVMRNALDYTSPKLIVVDCLKLGENMKTSAAFSQEHASLDAFPLSRTKWATALDLLDDSVAEEREAEGTLSDMQERTRISLLWDFSVYHSRWNEISAASFNAGKSREKGAESRIAVSEPMEIPDVPADKKIEEDTTGISYLRRMIEECQDKGIEILLVYLPFPAVEWSQMEAHRVYDIAEEYGVGYINFLDMDLVDYDTDCYDPNSHLNPSGAHKVTDYLGEYISGHYAIEDRRGQEAYSGWHSDYNDYKAFKAENLKRQTALDVYLMLLADKNYHAVIEIHNPAIWKNEHYASLLQNLGIQASQVSDGTDCFFVQEGGRHVDYLNGFYKSKEQHQTAAGALWQIFLKEGGRSVFLEDKVLYRIEDGQDDNVDICVAVLDKDSMETVDWVSFSFQSKDDVADGYIAVGDAVR